MRFATYVGRSLTFYWRSHVAVGLGVITATATLTGALLVGDSTRASLRDLALGRLGRVDHALVSHRFFEETTASSLAYSLTAAEDETIVCPAIIVRGGVAHADSGARVNKVTVVGTDDRFWSLAGSGGGTRPVMPTGRAVILNQSLAEQLAAKPGDDVLIRLAKPSAVSTETLLGRRDDTTQTLRLTVDSIIAADVGGDFSLKPRQPRPNNAFIPLATLQRAMDQPGRVNAIFVSMGSEAGEADGDSLAQVQEVLQQRVTLKDIGLRLRTDAARGYVAVEADSFLIEPAVERAAEKAAGETGAIALSLLTYLANSISVPDGEGSPQGRVSSSDERPVNTDSTTQRIPYSTVTALDTTTVQRPVLKLVDGSAAPSLRSGEILLNRWAAEDLKVKPGDRVSLSYYLTSSFGKLETKESSFVLRGIVDMDELSTDRGFTPDYPGVTDTQNLGDWDPPFPLDLKLVRDKDEEYWDKYRAAPKAFVSLAEGRELWTSESERFGQSTSIRITSPTQAELAELAGAFEAKFLEHLDIKRLGLFFEPVRENALVSSTGTTDFGMLFVSFSFFLIVSAAMLVALLFRLGVDRRCREVGILRATGFAPAAVTGLLIAEGAFVACVGTAIGLVAAAGYAWLMLEGLKSWWAAAANAPFLQLHVEPVALVIGFVASLLIALGSIAWSVRSLGKAPVWALLGQLVIGKSRIALRESGRAMALVGIPALVLACVLIGASATSDAVPQTVGFFGGGAALLVAAVSALWRWLRADRHELIARSGPGALLRLGISNAPRHPRRSLLTTGLIASATFVITAIEAFHIEVDTDTRDKNSVTGGFALYAESAVPLPYDLDSAEGRRQLSMDEAAADLLRDAKIIPFRLRPGDETSCRGLYRPNAPRIIGATDDMIERGGFVFAATLEELPISDDGEVFNPWTLLEHTFPDGAVPVIVEASVLQWQLHSALGKDLVITDEHGREVRLRFVATLDRSVLQDELIVAESQFVRLFPSISGHAFFLIDVPQARTGEATQALERELGTYAFDVSTTAQRLREYSAVQNTYLSTFQTLGGLGLVLGTVGLAVVLLRNVWERRGELALMRALGFSRATLGWLSLAENAVLVVAGLAAGAIPALIAISPHIVSRPAQVPWLSIVLTLLGVAVAGIGVGAIALGPTLRTPLLPALRRE
ncbi:MAG: ABC transporter permease [Phycisphaerales bacterium]|nr:MAG: ABC transporter permease [Phycisphaerales bacterium]